MTDLYSIKERIMITTTRFAVLFIVLFSFEGVLWAEPVSINNDDTINSVLTTQIDKRVIIRTKSGGELTGTVKAVNDQVTHLAEISGREFFDAVIDNDKIEAVIIRTRTK